MTRLRVVRRFLDRLAVVTPVQWLIVAVILHVATTLIVFTIGHFHLLPNMFDENGIGVGFAIDGLWYRGLSAQLVDTLRTGGLSAWMAIQTPFHSRLYSLTFIFPGSIVGYNILAAEPLNLIYYLGTLSFVYLLAKEIFDSRTGLVAAVIIGLWPSFLLHTTQFIRDSLSTCLMLALMYLLTVLLQRDISMRRTLLIGPTSFILILVLWLIKGNWWNIVFAALVFTLGLLLIRMFRERKFFAGNFVVLVVLFVTALLVPTRVETTFGPSQPTAVFAIPSSSRPSSSRGMFARFLTQIRARRGGFKVYSSQKSNIDADVVFNNAGDVIRFLPRAAVIGFFAPFPRMWFEAGASGRAGRIISGLETFVMYMLYVPAAVGFWIGRRKLAVWLIFLTTILGIIALGLVVVNAGALYRFRYIFWMFLIVMAAKGAVVLRQKKL